MPAIRVKSVAFGASRAGLTTVGYTLTGLARVATGVVEVVPGTGLYRATVTVPDGFVGLIVWDTGQAADLIRYAADEIATADFDLSRTGLAFRPLDAVPDAQVTVGDCLVAALCGAVGKKRLSGNSYSVMSPGSGTLIRTLILDDPQAPSATY
jgi:hypothetical protein